MNCPHCKQNFTPFWLGRNDSRSGGALYNSSHEYKFPLLDVHDYEHGYRFFVTQCPNLDCEGDICYVEYGYWYDGETIDKISSRHHASVAGIHPPPDPFHVLREVRLWPHTDADIPYPDFASDDAKVLCEEAHTLIHCAPKYAGIPIRKLIEVVLQEYGYSGNNISDQIELARKDETRLPDIPRNNLLNGMKDIAEAGHSSAHDLVPYGNKELHEYHLEQVYCLIQALGQAKKLEIESHRLANDRQNTQKQRRLDSKKGPGD